MTSRSLQEYLATVPDPRSRRGRRFPLQAVLSLVALALLMGRRSLEAISELVPDYGQELAWALGFATARTPCPATLSKLLRRLDATAVEAALSAWIAERLDDPATVLSLDGKTLRGSRDGEVPGQHLLSAYAPHVQAVLTQVRVDSKTNEHKAALQLLGILPVRGRVVVGDAMFCQRDLCRTIIDKGGDYVLIVKDNQTRLQTDVAAGFGFEAAAASIAAAFSPGEDIRCTGQTGPERR